MVLDFISDGFTGDFTRMTQSPAAVHKLGHFGYETDNYEATCNWYTSNFNFKPTDILHAPGKEDLDVATFFHLDLGVEYVDHHCLIRNRQAIAMLLAAVADC